MTARFIAALLLLAAPAAHAQTYSGSLQPGDAMDLSRGGMETFVGQYYDAYSFDAEAGEAIRVRQTAPEIDTYLIVRGPDGEEWISDDYDGLSVSQVDFMAPLAGSYTVWASAYAPDVEGAYDLSMQVGEQVMEHAGMLESGDSRRGEVQEPSGPFYDEYSFEATQGEMITVREEAPEIDTYLIVRGPEGEEWVSDDFEGLSVSQVTIVAPSSGTYTIWASAFSEGVEGDYTVTVSSSGMVQVETQTGTLDQTDPQSPKGEYHDQVTVEGGSGQIGFEVFSDEFDTYLVAVSPTGVRYTSDDDPLITDSDEFGSRIGMLGNEPGTWTLYVTSFAPESTGAYTLRIVRGDG